MSVGFGILVGFAYLAAVVVCAYPSRSDAEANVSVALMLGGAISAGVAGGLAYGVLR